MTERLYYRDAELLAFDATAIAHVGDAQHVVLDRTAFYPTSGGQPHDLGTLAGAKVVDVIDGDDGIVHVTDAPVSLGSVHGEIDAGRRHDHMQQHTAQHLLSALAADRLKWETVSVHFGAEHSTIEFATAAASDAQLRALEAEANAVVGEARPVTVTLEDAAEAARTGLRKPSERGGEIRVITIEGIDRSACGGTHVARTSAIGAVLLLDVEKIRGHLRVGFVAGDRVLARAHAGMRDLRVVAELFGCATSQVAGVASARVADVKMAQARIAELEGEVAATRLRALCEVTPRSSGGMRHVRHRAENESASLLRMMAQGVAPLERTTLVITTATPPTIYFATSTDSDIDAGARLKPALQAAAGRGGGSARVAQGTAPTVEELDEVAARLIERSGE